MHRSRGPVVVSARRIAVVIGLVVAAFFATSIAAGDAQAQRGPEKVFAGRILVSNKRFPTQAKSANAYIAALKKQSKTNFYEDKEKQEWKVYFAAFFKAPLDDLEVLVKLYDITNGNQALLSSFEQFTDARGQRTLISNMRLERKQFGVNKQLMMTIESRGRVLASGRFKILGEGEHFSGKVDFSSDEAAKGEGE
jgi:hypothetical protein